MHGLASDGRAVRCGIALWPYDLLLRFGYDLPENEHLWEGEWFDDAYERAALDMRSDAAKLVLALRAMDAAALRLRDAASPESAARDIGALKRLVQETPGALDLVLAYLKCLVDGLAKVIPCCYGEDGKALLGARESIETLADSPALTTLDGALVALLAGRPRLAIRTNQPDLYVIAGSGGFSMALPKAAARALQVSAGVTLSAVAEVDAAVAASFAWFDAMLAHLQAAVAERAEDGPDLLERWAEPDWAVIATFDAADGQLAAHLPRIP
jgi:hypothetical protein